MQQVEDSKKPVIAAISGSCMGRGLEVWFNCIDFSCDVLIHAWAGGYCVSLSDCCKKS